MLYIHITTVIGATISKHITAHLSEGCRFFKSIYEPSAIKTTLVRYTRWGTI